MQRFKCWFNNSYYRFNIAWDVGVEGFLVVHVLGRSAHVGDFDFYHCSFIGFFGPPILQYCLGCRSRRISCGTNSRGIGTRRGFLIFIIALFIGFLALGYCDTAWDVGIEGFLVVHFLGSLAHLGDSDFYHFGFGFFIGCLSAFLDPFCESIGGRVDGHAVTVIVTVKIGTCRVVTLSRPLFCRPVTLPRVFLSKLPFYCVCFE